MWQACNKPVQLLNSARTKESHTCLSTYPTTLNRLGRPIAKANELEMCFGGVALEACLKGGFRFVLVGYLKEIEFTLADYLPTLSLTPAS